MKELEIYNKLQEIQNKVENVIGLIELDASEDNKATKEIIKILEKTSNAIFDLKIDVISDILKNNGLPY